MERLDRDVDYGSRIMDGYSRIMNWPYTFGTAGGTTTDTYTTDINDKTMRQDGSLELDRHGSDD